MPGHQMLPTFFVFFLPLMEVYNVPSNKQRNRRNWPRLAGERHWSSSQPQQRLYCAIARPGSRCICSHLSRNLLNLLRYQRSLFLRLGLVVWINREKSHNCGPKKPPTSFSELKLRSIAYQKKKLVVTKFESLFFKVV